MHVLYPSLSRPLLTPPSGVQPSIYTTRPPGRVLFRDIFVSWGIVYKVLFEIVKKILFTKVNFHFPLFLYENVISDFSEVEQYKKTYLRAPSIKWLHFYQYFQLRYSIMKMNNLNMKNFLKLFLINLIGCQNHVMKPIGFSENPKIAFCRRLSCGFCFVAKMSFI